MLSDVSLIQRFYKSDRRSFDYHKTMDNYAKAKSILFKMVSGKDQIKDGKSAWINSDDPYAAVMSNAISDPDFAKYQLMALMVIPI